MPRVFNALNAVYVMVTIAALLFLLYGLTRMDIS